MSGLKGKTPSQSYGDLLVVGELYNGLSSKMEYFTDGLGASTNIQCSRHGIDINFNGGELTSYRFNSSCYRLDLLRSSWSDYHTVRVGNPPEVALITYYSDPYVSEDYEITVNLLPPFFINKFSSSPLYSFTNLLYSNAGNDSNIIFTSSDGYPINGLTSYYRQTGKNVSIIKIEFFSENISLGGEFFISLENEDFFNSGGEPFITKPESLCQDQTDLFEDYVRVGKSSKSAIPLAKASPGGSYRDLLYLNNNGAGIGNNLNPIQDGAGNNSLISISDNEVSVSLNGGFINDGIFGSSCVCPLIITIDDNENTYVLKDGLTNHAVLKYISTSSDEKDFYISVDIASVPYSQSSNSLEINNFTFTLSVTYSTISDFKIHVRFINKNGETNYYEKTISAGSSSLSLINNYTVLFNESIEEVFVY